MEDAAIVDAKRALAAAGIRLESMAVTADLIVPEAAPVAEKDEDFLRRLRIDPNLEVRE